MLITSSVTADDGHPVAIRNWEGQGVTIETMWGFHVGMGINDANRSKLPRKPDLELSAVGVGESKALKRLPNQDKIMIAGEAVASDDVNAVVVRRGTEGNPSTVSVDGLTIIYLESVAAGNVAMEIEGRPSGGDKLVVVAIDGDFDQEQYAAIIELRKPRLLIVKAGIEKVGDQAVEVVSHNTVAVSSGKRAKQGTRIVSLGTQGYQLSKELTTLFAKKEMACKDSRAVFAKLSVAQMNFKPANGTHTPRWNTEHMMGRELHFFSQIYHAVDAEIPVMNLNPAQMPTKYKFAHEDWTGPEEARQTERVEAFTRRFAYLFDGMNLNKKAKGSRFWTPRRLLAQMERHYKEHTGNVVKKMKLEGWPKE